MKKIYLASLITSLVFTGPVFARCMDNCMTGGRNNSDQCREICQQPNHASCMSLCQTGERNNHSQCLDICGDKK